MDTLLIELTNQKAYRLLKELEELNLIRVVKKPAQLSSLRKKIRKPMSDDAIDQQLHEIRNEWQRDI
jgi:chromosome segregation and condensation protein ScpB